MQRIHWKSLSDFHIITRRIVWCKCWTFLFFSYFSHIFSSNKYNYSLISRIWSCCKIHARSRRPSRLPLRRRSDCERGREITQRREKRTRKGASLREELTVCWIISNTPRCAKHRWSLAILVFARVARLSLICALTSGSNTALPIVYRPRTNCTHRALICMESQASSYK